MKSPSISLIVSTYNSPEFLRLVLDGIQNQSDPHFEVLIADDGSGIETKSCIERYQAKCTVKIKHIWHKDDGFRKSSIMNKAIMESVNPYIVCIDGDCIPRIHFVRDHRALLRKNCVVGCSRIMLDQTISQHLIDNNLSPHRYSIIKWLGLRLSGHINRILPFISIPMLGLRNLTPRNWRKIRGCNFGAWKIDMVEVGGFDESFTGWGYEDSDLAVRLINHGLKVRRGDYAAVVLHLWHENISRSEATSNHQKLMESIESQRSKAILGINNRDCD